MSNIDDRRDYGTFIPAYIDDMPLSMTQFRVYVHFQRLKQARKSRSVTEIALHCDIRKPLLVKILTSLLDLELITQDEYREVVNNE